MKYNIALILSIITSGSLICMEADMIPTTELMISRDVNEQHEETDQYATLRITIAKQTEQICNMLMTLSESVAVSNIEHKEQLRRELHLMCECMKSVVEKLPTMEKQALLRLIELNEIILNQLHEQLLEGNLQGLCHFTAAQFSTPAQQTRSFITSEQLEETVNRLEEKIEQVWSLVTAASLATYAETQQASNSFWHKITDHKQACILSLAALITAATFYKHHAAIDTTLWINRILSYSLMGLYILRQKKDADIKPIAERWFGENTFLARAMINAKHYVGSPKEKLPAVHLIARTDMTAQEQIAWADAQNCAIVKIEKGRDYNMVKDFLDLEDGLFKLPLAFFFAQRVKDDIVDLSQYIDNGAHGFFERLAHLISKAK